MYRNWIKRLLGVLLSSIALIVLLPLMAFVALLVRVKLGSPVIFKQIRPGMKGTDGKERLFTLYKFRSMNDAKDAHGNLLPDKIRLTRFGKKLRASSLDELPEFINIIRGDMSIVGPRPLLVQDMVFMTQEQRRRHDVRPGLTGWAQVNGRNGILWEDKFKLDLDYVQKVSLLYDLRIILITVIKVIKTESITFEGKETAEDLGDYLLRTGKTNENTYTRLISEAQKSMNHAR